MHKLQLVPECYAETAMVKELFLDFVYINHAYGIGKVCSILKKEDVRDYINIGFVDNDKHLPPYLDSYEELGRANNVVFKKHPHTNDYIIMVNPAIEKFLLSQLNEIEKSPSDYDLPDDFKEFKHKLKTQSIQNHSGFKRMLTDLKNSRPDGIRFIIDKVNFLQNN